MNLPRPSPRTRRILALVWPLLLIVGFALGSLACQPAGGPPPASTAARPGNSAVDRAFAERRSNLWVTVQGTVARRLADDRKGSPHQRFLLELPSGLTVLVAHNLDLATKVPLAVGETVEVSGEYEWNDRGGVLHWTHDDPKGRHDGGFIRHRGVVYR